MPVEWLVPDWPVPASVRALSTLRVGGFSQPPWDGFNLGDHVGDDPRHVKKNREQLTANTRLPSEPLWMKQTHGCEVLVDSRQGVTADACYSEKPDTVCVVMTADCLPVLLCDTQGSAVAAVHAGWRGLADGVLETALDCFGLPASSIIAWLGPAIGANAFEVGDDVRDTFLQRQQQATSAFVARGQGKWLADIYELARQRLQARGVQRIYGGDFCTFTESERFFSYRRDGRTGRMASLIWLEN